jgi:membrane fusion protein (multidrug efflux system)
VSVGGNNQWVVEKGLKPGDRVIVDGLSKLHPGAPIKLGGGPAAPGGAPAKDGAKPGGGTPAKDGAKSGVAPKS